MKAPESEPLTLATGNNQGSRFASDAVKASRANQEQASARNGGRGVVAVAEVVDGEHAEFRAGLEDVALARIREEEMSRAIRNRTCPRG